MTKPEEKKEKKKTKKGKKKGRGFLKGLIILVILLVAGYFLLYKAILVPDRSQYGGEFVAGTSRVNILLVGADSVDSDGSEGDARSDTIILASLDLKHETVSLLSIPRDTRVDIEGYKNKEKINHSYNYGGIDLLKQTVENLLLVPIDYYVIVDFEGFKDIIDILGGVEINVDKRMYYRTYDGLIDLQPGLQVLNGEQALAFVRFRHEVLGDVSRVQRQQEFLKAVFAEVMQVNSITKIPELTESISEMMVTDLSNTKLTMLAMKFHDINFDKDVFTNVLPGNFANIEGLSYWIVNEEAKTEVIKKYFSQEPIVIEEENSK